LQRKVWAGRSAKFAAEPAGKSALPPAHVLLIEPDRPMSSQPISRREVLKLGAVAAIGALPLMRVVAQLPAIAPPGTHVVYRLSLRGRRGSRAARRHNANHLFPTPQYADNHRAHPGDRSRIVLLTIGDREYRRLFLNPPRVSADLRHIQTAALPAWTRYR
jgi:hypothetical protein